jgi:O-methyltransferase
MTAANSDAQKTDVTPQGLYLDLMKKCLTRHVFGEHYHHYDFPAGSLLRTLFSPIRALLATRRLEIVKRTTWDPRVRAEGEDWPADAETMIGLKRLDNIEYCVTDVLKRGVPGDLIETGVWRGGAVILMRAILKAYGDTQRLVWAADSFQGLPKPDGVRYPADAGDLHWSYASLAVSLEQVQENFNRYGLLDGQVRFLKGWFKDTLPVAPLDRLAVIRLDGDMYESTMDALRPLYPRLSPGGYVIVDDYNCLPGCKKAVDDFRAEHDITEEIHPIDRQGVFWQRRG